MEHDTSTDDAALFTEHVRSNLIRFGGVVALGAGAARLTTGGGVDTVGFLVAGVLMIWFSSARYEVTGTGVDVRMGAGRPHIHLDSSDIRRVEIGTINPLRVGGWGYRGSWLLGHHLTVSLGGGDGILIETRTGGRLRLTSRHAAAMQRAIQHTMT